MILNICQLNQSSKFSTREHYVDLRCSLENTASINSPLTGDSRVVLRLVILSMTRLIWLYIYGNYVKGKLWPFPYKMLSAESSAFLADHLPVGFCLFFNPQRLVLSGFPEILFSILRHFSDRAKKVTAIPILRKQTFYRCVVLTSCLWSAYYGSFLSTGCILLTRCTAAKENGKPTSWQWQMTT